MILLALITSVGAVAVTAQTPSAAPALSATPITSSYISAASVVGSAPAPTVQLSVTSAATSGAGAGMLKPTTLDLLASSQLIKPGVKTQWVKGWLRTGSTYIVGQPVTLYYAIGPGAQKVLATGKTDKYGGFGWYISSSTAVGSVWYIMRSAGGNGYAAAWSNYVVVNYQTTTSPCETTLIAYAPTQVTKHGENDTIAAWLTTGQTPLKGKTVYLWQKTSSGWTKIIGKATTGTTMNPGWVKFSVKSSKPGNATYMAMFNGASPYVDSQSNTVQLVWT